MNPSEVTATLVGLAQLWSILCLSSYHNPIFHPPIIQPLLLFSANLALLPSLYQPFYFDSCLLTCCSRPRPPSPSNMHLTSALAASAWALQASAFLVPLQATSPKSAISTVVFSESSSPFDLDCPHCPYFTADGSPSPNDVRTKIVSTCPKIEVAQVY